MGRPSMAAVRREQILDAVTRCVGEYGLEGTTLERVAEASGFSRGHIRHYLGNREQLLEQFQQRLTSHYVKRMQQIASDTDPGKRGLALVQFLFGEEWEPGEDNAAINALTWAAARDETVRGYLRESYLAMEGTLAQALRADYPHAPAVECGTVAYTVLCLAFAHSTLLELSYPADRHRSVTTVTARLLDQLASFEPAGH